ncbi:hypothetical protein M422DRAFT_260366 [Sphaerobolus stellatus SS14]|uniref:Uncharacterized protein n=1 Tax=Sphaerobolus stellatus (strain SS14) TaxID=990650 RepID=A0A0C9U2W7_SPHS4|nr:hypothetical protein M422DRAFT_260366 [Sphaerobolus stellatus SS14]
MDTAWNTMNKHGYSAVIGPALKQDPLCIPDCYKELLPKSTLPADKLLQMELQKTSHPIMFMKPESCFAIEPPNQTEITQWLYIRAILADAWLKGMLAQVEAQMLKRAKSFFHPDFRGHCVRVRANGNCDPDSEPQTQIKEISIKQQLIKGFYDILGEQQDQGIGTDSDRLACWIARDGNSGAPPAPIAAGNAANAAFTARDEAGKIQVKRRKTFESFKLPFLESLKTGEITSVAELKPGNYRIAYNPDKKRLLIAKGKHNKAISIYNG